MSADVRGGLAMVASMAAFTVEDVLVKAAAATMPLGQVLALMGLAGAALFAWRAARAGEAPVPRSALSRTMAVRSGFEIAGRLFYALAIALVPISLASAILQATPIVVVLGAAVLFRERVGFSRWVAVVLGFVGVLVILRPGLEGFDALSLFAVAGMVGFAGRDLATRAAPPSLSNDQLNLIGFAMLGLSGLILLVVEGGPRLSSPAGWACVAAAAAVGVCAYGTLTVAMRTGSVAAVTPLRYSRLLFALALGALVFGERPDGPTLVGAAIVVLSGLIVVAGARRAIAPPLPSSPR